MTGSTSLAGRTALVTGGTAGIGFHTAAALARMGADVYVTGRDDRRGRDAEGRLRELAGHERVRFLNADMSTVGGNQRLARRLGEAIDRLHVLVNNAGGIFNDRLTSVDGYELTLAMNFVGPVAFTQALLPLLGRSAPARIVNVVSSAHAMWAGDPFADLHSDTSSSAADAVSYRRVRREPCTSGAAVRGYSRPRKSGTGVGAREVARRRRADSSQLARWQDEPPQVMPARFR